MKSLTLFAFMAVIATGYSLKCYSCIPKEEGDCETDKLDKDKDTMTCPDGMDKCMRTWGKDKDGKEMVANSCSNQATCDTAEEACKEPEEGECKVGCCDSDECNASSTVSFSVILMAACSVFGLALMK
ncbi:hypothetical protein ACROYT_G007839 [Oculina patagonica]